METVVIALGGNALLKKGQKLNTDTQEKNVRNALKKLFEVIKKNNVVITHGNGPQAGYLMMQQKKTRIDVIDAETGGSIGYMIQQNLQNLLWKNNSKRSIVTILTQVLVDDKDSSFKKPDKFVGPFYTKAKAMKLKFKTKKDSNRGYRRVVASPKPVKIIEDKTVKDLLGKNTIVIAAGGGGIPVVISKRGFKGVECIIDKDRASAVLGNSVSARELWMITDVPYVYLNYLGNRKNNFPSDPKYRIDKEDFGRGKKGEIALRKVSLKDMKKYYGEGHFQEGSMGPKIEAAIDFLEKGGKKVIITDIDSIGKRGSVIEK